MLLIWLISVKVKKQKQKHVYKFDSILPSEQNYARQHCRLSALIARFNEAVGSGYKVERGQLDGKGWCLGISEKTTAQELVDLETSCANAPCGVFILTRSRMYGRLLIWTVWLHQVVGVVGRAQCLPPHEATLASGFYFDAQSGLHMARIRQANSRDWGSLKLEAGDTTMPLPRRPSPTPSAPPFFSVSLLLCLSLSISLTRSPSPSAVFPFEPPRPRPPLVFHLACTAGLELYRQRHLK